MIRTAAILLTFLMLTSFGSGNNGYRTLRNDSFGRGEIMKYRAFFGFITAGEGTEQECYEQYKRLGYTVCALSHYQHITDFQKDSAYYISRFKYGILPHIAFTYSKTTMYNSTTVG